VRRIAALGAIDGVNELDHSLTLGEHLREALAFRRRRRSVDRDAHVQDVLERAGLDITTQPARPRARSRRPSDARCALALLNRPSLLLLDDIDHRLTITEQRELCTRIHASPETASPSSHLRPPEAAGGLGEMVQLPDRVKELGE